MEKKINGKRIQRCATTGGFDNSTIVVWGKTLKEEGGQFRIDISELLPLIQKRKWTPVKARKHTYLTLE